MQAELLKAAEARITRARLDQTILLTGILAGHDIANPKGASLDDDGVTLVVEVDG